MFGRYQGCIYLQNTRIAVGFAGWNFLLFLGLKTIKKVPKGKYDSYTRMLQMNPPQVTCPNNYNIVWN